METEQRLAECQRAIGYHFATPDLLEIALRHSSLRTADRECNERLEFLGDSVLGLVITEELYRLLPDQAEGELTRIKSAVVARGALYKASQRLGLVRFAEFARGVSRREELPVSVTANLVEAVIGAIYLDAGFFPAREFVLRHLGHEIEETLSDRGAKNYKSLLQHEVQQGAGATPTYRTLEVEGPQHRREFVVAALIQGREWGRASGPTKKEAEQEAARLALEAWQRRGQGRRRRGGHDRGGAPPRDAERGAMPEAVEETAGGPASTSTGPEGDRFGMIAGWEEPEADAPPAGPAPLREEPRDASAPPSGEDAPPSPDLDRERDRRRGGRGERGGPPRDRGRRGAAPRGSAPPAPPREPAVPGPATEAMSSAASDGFAAGIGEVPASPAPPRPAPASPEAVPATRVEQRRKAPPSAQPAAEGFDAGL